MVISVVANASNAVFLSVAVVAITAND